MTRFHMVFSAKLANSYAYLTLAERRRVAQLAIDHAAGVPVMIGIGTLRTRDVLALARAGVRGGRRAVGTRLHQKLTDDEVFGLYETVLGRSPSQCASMTTPAQPISSSATNCTAGSHSCRA